MLRPPRAHTCPPLICIPIFCDKCIDGGPPSRIRYEKSHPCVTCRVSRTEYDQLDELRRSQGKSFKQLLLTGAGLLKADGKRVLSRVELSTCSVCQKPLFWNLTGPTDRKLLEDIMRTRVKHTECVEKGAPPGDCE